MPQVRDSHGHCCSFGCALILHKEGRFLACKHNGVCRLRKKHIYHVFAYPVGSARAFAAFVVKQEHLWKLWLHFFFVSLNGVNMYVWLPPPKSNGILKKLVLLASASSEQITICVHGE